MTKKDISQAKDEFDQTVEGTSLNKDAWKRLKKNKMAITGLYIIILYVIISLCAPILPIYSYKKIILDHAHLPPSLTKTAGELMIEKKTERYENLIDTWKKRDSEKARKNVQKYIKKRDADLNGIKERVENETAMVDGKLTKIHQRRYILGTDYHGRDLLARIIYGGQISMLIGFIGAITSVFIGVIVGSIAGYAGGKTDYLITRVIDVMYSLPYILLVIIFMALFGQNILNMFFAIAMVSWLNVARVVRGQIISLNNSEFVEAAKSIGASTRRIIFKHMVPNTVGIIIVFASLEFPAFIMTEAFLSFLGLGISAPYTSWGLLVREAIEGLAYYPGLLFFPAIAMTLFLFAMNFLGDGLRDAFDPQSKNRM